jgi:hypothetical protein
MKYKKNLIKKLEQGLQVLFHIVMAKFPIPENCSAYVIYTRHLNAQQAGVVPIYYSYHDMTYISVDMQQLQ